MIGNQNKPYAPAMVKRSEPQWDRDREAERQHRKADARFIKILHQAIWDGENIPAGQPKPLRLIG